MKNSITIVLNSLTDEYIPHSLDLLCHNGRFVEIGKRNIWTTQQVFEYRSDIQYKIIQLDTLVHENTNKTQDLLNKVVSKYNTPYSFNTIPITQFENIHKGLEFLQKGLHIGKVCWVNNNNTSMTGKVLITGGTGGLGKVFTNYLLREYPLITILL